MADELANFKLQLQQVEAALLGDPKNDELIKLKSDLNEIIALQEELIEGDKPTATSSFSAPARIFEVGDRVMAPLPTGNKAVAVVNSITAAGYAITFINSGQKTIVDPSDLGVAPDGGKKYVFDKEKQRVNAQNKKEWQMEREKRRLKAQKKDMKKKELETAKEAEKSSWQKFNNKAAKKGLQGFKRINVSGSSQDTAAKKFETVSSRTNQFSFKSTRGNMDSLF
ncbi:unnamed protein product [Auanema sp. JU1783]|nr:unnamed protein product [Auanema sp. JU1783]